MRYNHGIMPTDAELQRQKTRAYEKETHAIIARDFSASRMNATKWREIIEALSDLLLNYRFQWVHVPGASEWMNI